MRNATQEQVINAEQYIDTFLALSVDLYWEQDEGFKFKEFSADMSELIGTHVQSHYGYSSWNLSLPDSERTAWKDHQSLLTRHESFRNFEQKRLDQNGDVVWLLASGDPIFDLNNLFMGYRGVSRVITEQKSSEAALKHSQDRLHLSVNMSGIGIWEWDMISDHVVWDKRQFQLFERAEVEGPITLSSITDVIHPDDREQLNNTAQHVLEHGTTAAEEFRIILPDGSVRWLLASSGVVSFDEKKTSARLIGVNMDITESKETEIALRESQRHLQTANATLEARIAERSAELDAEARRHANTQSELAAFQKLEMIGQLAGGVAHDFNNLLAIIGGNLELAMAQISDATSREFVSKSLAAVNSGIGLNRRLLTFARKKNLKPVKLALGKQLLDMVSLLERTLGHNISITTKINETTWDAFVDPGEIDSALINLSVNARDAMPNGGQLTIETCNMTLIDEDVEKYPDTLPGDYVGLIVTDTGTGMSESVIKKAIDPFFTTKDSGSGLGLSSIYGFARQSGGFLSIDSRMGYGTTIRVFLPRATEQSISSNAVTTNGTTLNSTRDELILVVEDDPLVRELTTLRLKNIGYYVVEASTGQEAVNQLKENPEIKLVFSDIVMPGGMTGYALAFWVETHRPEVKVVLTSGYYDTSSDGTNQEVDERIEVLEKPYQSDELANSIRRALNT